MNLWVENLLAHSLQHAAVVIEEGHDPGFVGLDAAGQRVGGFLLMYVIGRERSFCAPVAINGSAEHMVVYIVLLHLIPREALWCHDAVFYEPEL